MPVGWPGLAPSSGLGLGLSHVSDSRALTRTVATQGLFFMWWPARMKTKQDCSGFCLLTSWWSKWVHGQAQQQRSKDTCSAHIREGEQILAEQKWPQPPLRAFRGPHPLTSTNSSLVVPFASEVVKQIIFWLSTLLPPKIEGFSEWIKRETVNWMLAFSAAKKVSLRSWI